MEYARFLYGRVPPEPTMHRISLRQVAIFHAVMTSGNLTEAATQLRTSQPTVSRELARFEQLLALKLFDRVRGRLRPTAQGLQLFEEVQRAYCGLERIEDAASQIRQFRRATLDIVCLPAFSQSLLPQVCRRFLECYPEVSLTITPQESPLLEEWLSAQRYDLGLTEECSTPPGCERHALATLNEVCVMPADHPLLHHAILTPAHFAAQPYISLSAGDSYRHTLDALFQRAGVARRMVAETHSAAAVCALVRQGIGLSIVNPLTALDFVGRGLAWRPFSVAVPFTVSLIRPRHRPGSAVVDALIVSLQEELAAVAEHLREPYDSNENH
ncbi:LysR family transcriptional regulator [Edwardsiella ictaluri]|nr:LysR family transcriptional regulator [Edwardsiella ictaluri]WJH22081.1 LysR family transcriptional regulator [Edwardsiella ictaluri]STP84224.1 Cyn operon transcriptional activator [Edwardsiella ictaluri]